jgi:hypothetical protein
VAINLFYKQLKLQQGPTAYQQYMSPYQQDVIDTTLQEYDIQAQKGMQPLAASQVAAGAFWTRKRTNSSSRISIS